jgi:hypothetical protein
MFLSIKYTDICGGILRYTLPIPGVWPTARNSTLVFECELPSFYEIQNNTCMQNCDLKWEFLACKHCKLKGSKQYIMTQ